MKRFVWSVAMATVGFTAGWLCVGHLKDGKHAADLAAWHAEKAAWQSEQANLEAALANANSSANERPLRAAPVVASAAPESTVRKASAQEILEKLKVLRIPSGPGQGASARQVTVLLNELAQLGSDALPAIRQFLMLNQDVDYTPTIANKGLRDVKILTESVLPASLRFGLFDVVRQIGGEGAEKLLAELLGGNSRGVEVAYLDRVLEEMAPGKYAELAMNTARDLLAKATPVSNSPLDKYHREYLFALLKLHQDTAYVATAQAQLIQADGKIDRGALNFLQQMLDGPQSLAMAEQAFQDPRVKDSAARESLARVGLAQVGINPQAEQMFHKSIFDPSLAPAQRSELVRDLDQDGLIDDHNLTPADVPVVANRLALTQTYLQQDYVLQDKGLTSAFLTANKDLRKLLDKAAAAANQANQPKQ